MAAITSSGSGDWNVGGTWTGGVAPVEGDTVTIQNGHTVTIRQSQTVGNDTATAAIRVQSGGKLQVLSTLAADSELKCKGDVFVDAGGVFEIGTPAAPIPAGRKFTLTLGYSAQAASDARYGLNIDGTFTAQGAPMAFDRSFLAGGNNATPGTATTDSLVNAGATALTTADATGWKNGDLLAIPSTNRTWDEFEKIQLTADAVGTSLGAFTRIYAKTNTKAANALEFSHSYEATPVQALIANLSRNVVIQGWQQTYSGCILANGTGSIVNLDWVEITAMGSSSSTAKFGICIRTTTGLFEMDHCSIHDFRNNGFAVDQSGGARSNWFVRDCVMYYLGFGSGATIAMLSTGTTMPGSPAEFSGVYGIGMAKTAIQGYIQTVSLFNCRLASCYGVLAAKFTEANDFFVHSMYNGIGLTYDGQARNRILRRLKAFRSYISATLNAYGSYGLYVEDSEIAGVQSQNGYCVRATFVRCILGGDKVYGASAVEPWCYYALMDDLVFEDCKIQPYGYSYYAATPNAYDVWLSTSGYLNATFINCSFGNWDYNTGSPLMIANQFGFLDVDNEIRVHNRAPSSSGPLVPVSGNDWVMRRGGFSTRDTAVFRTFAPSEKVVHMDGTYTTRSAIRQVPVEAGDSATVEVWVRRQALYTGTLPRLVLKRHHVQGIEADTVLAQVGDAAHPDLGANQWIKLDAQTPVAVEDTVFEVYVEHPGNTGIANSVMWVDDWAVN